MANFSNTYQFPENSAGTWHREVFGNNNPITLELACGRGDYTVGLARLFPERNFIGVDIKGSRIWRGAKTALEENMNHVAFLRTYIERIESYFAPGEVSEIWITFPDPHPPAGKSKKRLSSLRFLQEYRKFIQDGGQIHLKTDDKLLFDYSCFVAKSLGLEILDEVHDVLQERSGDPVLDIRTYYETRWITEGKKIQYLRYRFDFDRFTPENIARAESELAEWLKAHNAPRPY